MYDLFEPERSFTEPLCSPTGSPALIQPQKTLENADIFLYLDDEVMLSSNKITLCGVFTCLSLVHCKYIALLDYMHGLISLPLR